MAVITIAAGLLQTEGSMLDPNIITACRPRACVCLRALGVCCKEGGLLAP